MRYPRNVAGRILLYVAILFSLIAMLFPIGWMLSTAFKPASEVFAFPPTWIPANPTFEAFRGAITGPLARFFLNSFIVAAGTTLLATFSGALAAYALSRFPFRGSQSLLLFFLASLAFPLPLLMISMYMMFAQLRLLNSFWALIIGHTVITLPIVVWLLKSFFDTLPREVEEAAYIDGAGPFHTLIRIVFPMSRPGLAASSIFIFVTSWNEFMFGLTFTSSNELRPLPAGISLVFLQEFQYRWPEMMAVATIATIPILALFLFFQRQFIQGLTVGAVKG
ncbi:MAG: carbohydrate ABC transporter permease [Chloroflexota bacterium]|nr:MAG: carbohydrate ABC transporter permease [Chloroflexota bacterium]